jgi:hypothetical protein
MNSSSRLLLLVGLLGLLGSIYWIMAASLPDTDWDWLEWHQTWRKYLEVNRQEEQLLAQVAVVQRYFAIKDQATEDLAHGRITLEQAVSEFQRANRLEPFAHSDSRARADATSRAKVCEEVLSRVEGHLSWCREDHSPGLMDRLRCEATEFGYQKVDPVPNR